MSYLACAAQLLDADGCDLSRVRHPQRPHDRPRSQALAGRARSSSSSGCTAWARTFTRGHRPSRKPIGRRLRIYAPGRRPQGPARLPRAPPARERRQPSLRQPHGRCRRAGRRAGRRSRCATSPRLEPQPQSAHPAAARHLPRAAATAHGDRPRRSAGTRAAAGRARARCDGRDWAAAPTGARRRESAAPRAPSRSRRTARRRRRPGARRRRQADVDLALCARRRRAARLGRARRPMRAPRSSSAPPICSKRTPPSSSRCASAKPARRCPTRCRSARGGRFPALLRGRRRAAVRRAAAAAGPDRRAQHAAPPRPRRVRLHHARGISRWRSSPGRSPPRSPPATP